MFDLLINRSPMTGFCYYTSRQGNAYILYVKLEPHQNKLDVRDRAFKEIGVGELAYSLTLRGVKGNPQRLATETIGGFLPIASFDGKRDSRTPSLRLISAR